MNDLSNLGKVIVVAVLAAILIIVAIVYNTSDHSVSTNNSLTAASSTNQDNLTGGTTLTAESPAQVQKQQTQQTSSAPQSATKASNQIVIHVITPVKNDIWKIGTQDMISWNTAGDISGSLSLIDAMTGQFIGTILPQVGPNQTSYTWNTLNLLLDRTSPLGKNVVTGTYEIRIAYDGNDIQPATSPVFTITN